MKRVLKKIIIPLLTIGLSITAILNVSAADLSEWAMGDYTQASAAGLLPQSIVSSDLNGNITREEFCELVMNLYSKMTHATITVPENSPFKDTNNTAVKMAYKSGIIAGTSEDTFHPNKPITRQEMAKMLIETMNVADKPLKYVYDDHSALDQFPDSGDISSWAKTYMTMMVSNRLMNGLDDGTLSPLGNATRQQAIVSVNRSYFRFQNSIDSKPMPVVTMPKNNSVISESEFEVRWDAISGVVKYHLIVKSTAGVCLYDTATTSTKAMIDSELLDGYTEGSITIGAEFSDGVKTFSKPVDFSYTYASETNSVSDTKNSNTEYVKPDYSAEAFTSQAAKILSDAEQFLGLPYIYGGSTPKGFDCSGFTKYIFGMSGITLHRVSRDQYAKDGVKIAKSELQPGDLVFFGENGRVGHVGIYAGNGKMIHSPRTGKSICYTSIESNYYVSRYIGAKRVLK